jgi:hypothetical protein
MSRRRIACAGLAAVIIAAGTIMLAPGATAFVALYLNAAWRAVFPSTISWDAKDAFAKCSSAIATADWPKVPAQACAAMHLCANEAVLSERERRTLDEAIRKTEGCGEL